MSEIIHGDCIEIMAAMDEASVDAIATDPPYLISFMGKQFDTVAGGPRAMQDWHSRWSAEAIRVLRPGGHCAAMGGTRTVHRLMVALEDAGLEIRDLMAHMFLQGFPKNHAVDKAIEKLDGDNGHEKWKGWGTALKPAVEYIVICRRPLSESSVARNVLEHSTGGLNIGACRVPSDDTGRGGWGGIKGETDVTVGPMLSLATGFRTERHERGRWPANTLRTSPFGDGRDKYFLTPCFDPEVAKVDDALLEANGFFFVPKASRSEREFGCEGLEESESPCQVPEDGPDGQPENRKCRECGGWQKAPTNSLCRCDQPEWELRVYERAKRRNTHATVKPLALFRTLVRLLTPPGGTVLDPFFGSGTTGCAAILEGFDWVGIEQDEHYCQIARARTKAWAKRHAEQTRQLTLAE